MKRFQSSRRDQLADPYIELRLFRTRTVLISLLGVVLVVTLIARLYHLQVTEHQHYATESTNNRVHLNAIAPARGLIFDRHGFVLAHNLPAFQLEITAEDVEDLEETLQKISMHIKFSERDVTRFRKSMRRAPPFQGVPIRFNLTENEVALFSVMQHDFPGVNIVATLRRHYPNAELAGHTVGYVGRIDERELEDIDPVNYRASRNIGKVGVEKQFESLLHGTVGHQQVEVNVAGRVLRVLEEVSPIAGAGIYLTLDSGLQQIAEQALGDNAGAIVALDPQNGEVLAMVSKPSFNLNLFVDGISFKNYAKLRDDWRRPLFNRSTSGTYPPGSTVKPLLALAALENHTLNAFSKVYCPGYYRLPKDDHKYRDWKHGGHGFVTLDDAIVQSCDVMFYDLANKLGIDAMAEYLDNFGFGRQTGIDMRQERSGILPSREWKRQHYGQVWYPGETLIAGIGQGYFTATPLQIAHSMGILATRGQVTDPHLLYAVQPTPSERPQLYKVGVSDVVGIRDHKNWESVIKSMVKVTRSRKGTARSAFLGAPYKVAGKTGTAQVFSVAQDAEYDKELLEKRLQDHALFAGFAPVDSPKIAIAVIVENGGGGGSVAAPIARKLFDAWLLAKGTQERDLLSKNDAVHKDPNVVQ